MLIFKTIARRAGAVVKTLETNGQTILMQIPEPADPGEPRAFEPSFDPKARSPAGASGLFQLMPATAKRYGLKTWPLDQRLKPEASARAAAQYLEYLHGHFKDWRLALAAYNAGEGTVQRMMSRHKARTYDEIATHLPAETQLYVPRVEATVLRREGVKLAELR